MGDEGLQGEISPSLLHLPFLNFLDLSGNEFDTIPSFIGSLNKLVHLDLSDNYLFGNVPPHLGNISTLKYLDIGNNHIKVVDTLEWISHLSSLEYLNMDSVDLYSVSDWLQSITKLSLRGNITTFPLLNLWLNQSYFLQYLDLSLNSLVGEEKLIEILKLNDNKIVGSLDDTREFNSLKFLDVSSNSLNGTISEFSFSNFSKFNFFTEKIPECLGKLNDLYSLNLANNNLFGEIPLSIGHLNNMVSLHLRSNRFVGEFPVYLQNCTSLKVLDLGNNHFTGGIPASIGESLKELKILCLDSNELKGSIPSNICQLQSIQIIDLSLNHLSGSIPTCVNSLMNKSDESMPTMEFGGPSPQIYGIVNSLEEFLFDYEWLMWKGIKREYGKNLKFMKFIDLSSNKLVGEIPVEITDLHMLDSLNLSRNKLTGSIPEKIGQMSSLESLDLSNNQLSGAIPLSLASISFLAHLDLSNNNLSGCIPLGPQLQGFTEAYQGNSKLRGPPLQTKCHRDEPGNAPQQGGIEEDEGWIIWDFDFFVSMALGFILGFWGVCGTLILKRSWRHAYFQFLEDKKEKLCTAILVYGAKLKRGMHGS
nr:receptor-like protein 12 isoform X1 [Ipomoea batatas]